MFATKVGLEVGNLFADGSCGYVPALSARLTLALLNEEGVEQRHDPVLNRARVVGRAKFRAELQIVDRADLERLRPGLAMPPAYVVAEHLGFDAGGRLPVCEAKPASQRRREGPGVVEGYKSFGEAQCLLQQIVESEGAGVAGHAFQRFPDRRVSGGRNPLVSRLFHVRTGLAPVDHSEMRRDIRLEREEPQKPFAERVKGLDPQAPRRLDRACEQLSGKYEILRSRFHGAGLDDRGGERLVAEARPLRERVEDARRHVGRGRLGEGQAENLSGRRAGEQETQHPLGQDMRLATARICRHPGGRLWIRRLRLHATERVGNDETAAHDASPASPFTAPPVSDHSLTRARWL